MLARARQHSAGLYLFVATFVANVLGYGYQVVMARLLRPEDYAVLTALFGILILESISSQVIQSATAKLAAQYRARDGEAALHAFVRRWAVRVGGGAAAIGLLVAVLSGLLQGLARFVWMGTALIAQAGARLTVGVVLVLAGLGVDGAFTGATAAIAISLAVLAIPLVPLFRAARGSTVKHELGAAETRFFALSAVVLLAYAALTNIDAVLARSLLGPDEAGAYAAAITMGKIVLFAPIAIGFLLLERTARAHARGEDTDRALFVSLGFVLATSGGVAVAYLVAPELLTRIVVGDQYPLTPSLIGPYALAALLNALLSLWI